METLEKSTPVGLGKIYIHIFNSNSKVRATASVNYAGLVLKGLRVVNGDKGLFISPPSEKDKNSDKWLNPYYFADRGVKTEVEKAVLAEYQRRLSTPEAGPASSASDEGPRPQATEQPPLTADEDIPF